MSQQQVMSPPTVAPPVYRAHRRFSFQAPSSRDAPAPFEFGTSYGSAARKPRTEDTQTRAQKPTTAASLYAMRRPSYNSDTVTSRTPVTPPPRVRVVPNGIPLPVTEEPTSGRRRRGLPVNVSEHGDAQPYEALHQLPPTHPDAARMRNNGARTCHSPDVRVTCCGVTSPRANGVSVPPVWPQPHSPEARNDVMLGQGRQQIQP